MAKKRGLQILKKAVKRTVKAAGSKNPPFWAETFYVVAPALTSYTVTRLAGRASCKYLAPRFPRARAYLPLAGSLAAAGALYYATTAVPSFKKYKHSILAGAGVALAQTLLLTVAPQLAWLFDLPAPARALPARAPTALLAQDAALDALEDAHAAPDDLEGLDDEPEEVPASLADDDMGGGTWNSPLTN